MHSQHDARQYGYNLSGRAVPCFTTLFAATSMPKTFLPRLSPEHTMKSPLLVAALSAWLVALPALAQLGPAGVPGAPGLAETDPSVKAAKPEPVPPTAAPGPAVAEPKSPPPKRAKTAKKPKIQASCQAQTGKNAQRCAPKPSPKTQCSAAPDPARCELHAKARETCKGKQGDAHRQCLRDTLAPNK